MDSSNKTAEPAADKKPDQPAEAPHSGSLESGLSLDATADTNLTTEKTDKDQKPSKKSRKDGVKHFFGKLNIYFLAFILLIVIAGVAISVAVLYNRKTATTASDQTLTDKALKDLKSSTSKVGDPKQTLNIESNAVFAGTVLVRDSLDVAGTIRVGGALSLPGITVSGKSSFDQVQINSLAIAGNASVQGTLTVQKSLSVSSGGSFTGPLSAPQITVGVLQLTGDLQLGHHIDPTGASPSSSGGSALGGGGTAGVSGTDTAGTVSINTGSSPAAGCFITVNFTQKFNGTPHVIISPVNSNTGSLSYYTNRSVTNFSVCATNPAAGTNYVFDYVVLD
ncbi:MAG: hypothetical protein JWS12_910 [Candidatus Saccharibacteria bacterium]|nr:hypothetical protein [Candidatus Saccharibacteria bacterium]